MSIYGENSGKIFDTDISIALATYIQWCLRSLGSCMAVILSPSLATDYLDCQSQYITEKEERETKNKTITLPTQWYEPISPTSKQYSSVATIQRIWPTEKHPLHWYVIHPMLAQCIAGLNRNEREEKEIKKKGTIKCPNCFCVLHTSAARHYTSPHAADQNWLGKTA